MEIESYPGVLSQIITNLIINAITHAFDGMPSGNIHISAKQSDGKMELEFSDKGKGMSADIQSKIYDPFFTTKRGAGGSGLGLYLIYNLVTQTLGGNIACRSQPGLGTTFTIQWPQSSAAGSA